MREADKFDALTRIIDVEPEFYGIIFCPHRRSAPTKPRRAWRPSGYAAEVLHGDVSQAQREKILRKFRDQHGQYPGGYRRGRPGHRRGAT